MKLSVALLALVLDPTARLQAQSTPASPTPLRILALYNEHTESDHVDFAHQANTFFAAEARAHNFDWVPSTNWNDLNEATLQQYRLVVWLDDEPRTEPQRLAFEHYMERGGGWLGFHVAAYNDADSHWPWFVQFLGGAVFFSNNWPPLPADLAVDDPENPILRDVPASFRSPPNEWYLWKPDPRDNKDVRVLLSLKPSNYPLGLKDVLTAGDLPVAWTNTRYRMLYLNMGHGDKIFSSPLQNQIFERSVLSLLGTLPR